ncbi:probable flavin-containing monoamine oxidase A [Diadema setosum]|uniref:probable flavin-containing monoamine oxidase A n=1 Tax=Diadema setosum TaxID=31175 RepID=UPI003B3BD092
MSTKVDTMTMANGSVCGTYTTPIDTYNINRYVTVSYTKMKRPNSAKPYKIEVITGDDDETKSRGSIDSFDQYFDRPIANGVEMHDEDFISPVDAGAQMSAPPTSLSNHLGNGYPEPEPPLDVVVVGAGLSGLTAAYALKKKHPNLKLVVLEANSHVGGRTLSPMMNTATGTRRFDLGDQWVSTEQRTILELLDELELETYPEHKEGKNILIYPDGSREEYSGNIYPINPFRRLDISSFVSRIESMREDMSKKDPTDLSESLKWDAITLEQFKQEHIWTDAARQVFDALVAMTFGVTPREMSLLFFCHVLNSVGGWRVMFGEDDEFPSSRQLKIKGGAQQLCERLATGIDRANLRLDDPVLLIDQTDKQLVVVSTDSGCQYRARRVLVATSVAHSVRIMHKPDPPLKRQALASLMPAGFCIKYVVTYEKAFWRKNGKSGLVLKLVDEEKAFDDDEEDLIAYEFVFDACAPNRNPQAKAAENPALMGVIFSEELRLLTPAERERRILKKLADVFGKDALSNIDYGEMDWGVERYTSGYPFSVMAPGALIYHSKALKKPFGRIHYCGTEMASAWYGFMEGSVKSGKRAAHEIAKDLRLKSRETPSVS